MWDHLYQGEGWVILDELHSERSAEDGQFSYINDENQYQPNLTQLLGYNILREMTNQA